MKTSPLTHLAALFVFGACGVLLPGGEASAQIHTSEYTARPLPPLPTNVVGQPVFNESAFPAQTLDSAIGHRKPKTLFTIAAPPVPKDYDVSARIVRPGSAEVGPNKAAVGTDPTPTAQTVEPQPDALVKSSSFGVTVQPPKNILPPTAVSFERVAELPRPLDTQNQKAPEAFFVAVQNLGYDGDLEPVLDAPVSDAAAPEMEAGKMLENGPNDKISIDPDSFQESEAEDFKSLKDDDAAITNGGDSEETEKTSPQQTDDLADLDREEDEDDDEENEEDEDEDDLQPEARQFGVWPKKSIQEVNVDVRDFYGQVPADESGALIASTQRYYRSTPKTEKVFAWAAPKIRYQPLYFEDAQLERYGQTKGLIKQPIVSGFKFFRDAALLPLNASIDCPGSCDGPLGFCRPGSPCGNSGCTSCQR